MSYQRLLDVVAIDRPYIVAVLSTAISANTQGATLRITMPSFQAADEMNKESSYIKKAADKAYGRRMNVELRGPR